ncbi:hypothetical protein GLAREA_04834 [Glarea lozoyensis ATCC 20868]|uniref:Uncharacterized protein n=1 Tax=Glarea lozoyensis (strain ATCC 20868 / MF5171) TaxID=1116229 RepID=S3DNI9_GLAL2|nr:uncharacterized protein GLAREA_04834 [Glarea lozoyensis ATCC 20868]EPE28043.1 hypothetical protein GLAREA_04834 [Glarea lozoyensis ATCC 20868]
MASWVFLGAQADDKDDTDGIKAQFEPPGDKLVIGTGLSEVVYTITEADTASTTLYLLEITRLNGVDNAAKARKIQEYCIKGLSTDSTKTPCNPQAVEISLNVRQPVAYDLAAVVAEGVTSNTYYYFFCFINLSGLCSAYSPVFFIPDRSSPQLPPNFVPFLPSGPATLQSFATNLNSATTGSLTSAGPSTATESSDAVKTWVTVSSPPTNTVTSTPTATAGASSESVSSSSKGGLSIGAKVGIAVGAVAVVLAILILALLFLRKKHRQRSSKERLMLSHSLNADSRDLITEKEITPTSYQIPNLNFASPGSPASETRHLSVLSPYDPVSQPYTGSAASIPRRKPTLSTASASAVGATAIPHEPVAATIPISREVSRASSHIPSTRSIGATEPSPPPQNYEQYHDVPQYSHGSPQGHGSPQVFQGGLQAPYLSETDSERGGSVALTEADHARLAEEEEERRIDAAIAESERLKNSHGR